MMCVGGTPGIWRHPRDCSLDYNTLEYWTELARLLERGRFDSLFIADILGVYDVYCGGPEPAIRHAVEFPLCDPMLTVPAMALVTEHLGFAVTGTISYETPYAFARRVSTLDHLTKGRFAWNIVTGYLDSAARAFGLKEQLTHDERYERGDEFMEIMYALWEGSWEEGAVIRDQTAGVFADPARIHPVRHRGRYYEMEGRHLCEPSPQRTPMLFQAGASERGRDFAARHAEGVYVSGRSRAAVARTVADLRRRAAGFGRDPSSLKTFVALSVIVAETDAAARAKFEEYENLVDIERTLTLISGYSGVDYSSYDLDTPLTYFKTNALQTFVENCTIAEPGRVWTLRDAARRAGFNANVEIGSIPTLASNFKLHFCNRLQIPEGASASESASEINTGQRQSKNPGTTQALLSNAGFAARRCSTYTSSHAKLPRLQRKTEAYETSVHPLSPQARRCLLRRGHGDTQTGEPWH